ncbi:hypothetical protein PG990_001262 [Apiospora arundinis]
MSFNISSVGRGNYMLQDKWEEEDRQLGYRPTTSYELSTSEDENWGLADSHSSHGTLASELEDITIPYTRETPSLLRATERNHLEIPTKPERWDRTGRWEGCAYLKVEDGANDRGFMEPMERTPHQSKSRLLRYNSIPSDFRRMAFGSSEDEDGMRDCCEFFDWADKEWTESFAGRSKEEILERDLFRDEFRDWTPSELKARFGVTSKAYLVKMLRRRKLVLRDGEAYDAMVGLKRTLQGTSGSSDDDVDDDTEDDECGDKFLEQQHIVKTLWGHMTEAEQDAFSTALAQTEVGMCKVSSLCDLPQFDGYPQTIFVPLSPTKEYFEPRTP